MVNAIGETAGIVWVYLSENGAVSVAKLKTALKADAFILNASIGWLAREEKIQINKVRNSLIIDLK
jgi:hypothetical protein